MSENLTLDVSSAPLDLLSSVPSVGDVFQKAGGGPGFWVVVSINGGTAYVLSFGLNGEVNGAQSYRASYFAERSHRRVGRVAIPAFSVEWDPQ